MKKKVFYSWQSDLENNTNRGLIGDCLQKALDSIEEDCFDLDPVVDRDTLGEGGSPDIAQTIFNKIDRCHILVADISIINPDYVGRKMPNPNVLIELGYASKSLGWDHVITVFNTDTGRIEDLPFDLKIRRPFIYSGKERVNDKKRLSKDLSIAIKSILVKDTPTELVRSYYKSKIDRVFFKIYKNLRGIMFGEFDTKEDIDMIALLQWSEQQVQEHLYEGKRLGFYVFKDWEYYAEQIDAIISQPAFGTLYDIQMQKIVISLIKSLRRLSFTTMFPGTHKQTEEVNAEYRLVKFPERFGQTVEDTFALQKIEGDKNKFVDDGMLISEAKSVAKTYFKFVGPNFPVYTKDLQRVLDCMNQYESISPIDPLPI